MYFIYQNLAFDHLHLRNGQNYWNKLKKVVQEKRTKLFVVLNLQCASVVKWLRSLTCNHQPLTTVSSNLIHLCMRCYTLVKLNQPNLQYLKTKIQPACKNCNYLH